MELRASKIMFSGDGREGVNYTKHRSQGSESLTWYLFGGFRWVAMGFTCFLSWSLRFKVLR